MTDYLVRLERVSADDWDGTDDGNVDVRAVFSSEREVIFTAFTPKNILRLLHESLLDAKSFLVPNMLIVRRIDEECLRDAVQHWMDAGM